MINSVIIGHKIIEFAPKVFHNQKANTSKKIKRFFHLIWNAYLEHNVLNIHLYIQKWLLYSICTWFVLMCSSFSQIKSIGTIKMKMNLCRPYINIGHRWTFLLEKFSCEFEQTHSNWVFQFSFEKNRDEDSNFIECFEMTSSSWRLQFNGFGKKCYTFVVHKLNTNSKKEEEKSGSMQ